MRDRFLPPSSFSFLSICRKQAPESRGAEDPQLALVRTTGSRRAYQQPDAATPLGCRQEGPRRVLRGQIWLVERKSSTHCDRDVATDSRDSDRESGRRVGLARLTRRRRARIWISEWPGRAGPAIGEGHPCPPACAPCIHPTSERLALAWLSCRAAERMACCWWAWAYAHPPSA